MILNIYVPDSGSVRLFGEQGSVATIRRGSAICPKSAACTPRCGCLTFLLFLAELKGVERRAARSKALHVARAPRALDWRMRKVNELSKGMQQKVQFISTILHEPNLLVMDEAFSGLDRRELAGVEGHGARAARRARRSCSQRTSWSKPRRSATMCASSPGARSWWTERCPTSSARTAGVILLVNFDGARGNADAVFADRRLVAKADASGQFAELELRPRRRQRFSARS